MTDNDLLSFNSKVDKVHNFKNISIIIPAYNQDVIPTLLSIQGQNLTKEEKGKIQVVLINDGSKNDLLYDINNLYGFRDWDWGEFKLHPDLYLEERINQFEILKEHKEKFRKRREKFLSK